jgi:sortase A
VTATIPRTVADDRDRHLPAVPMEAGGPSPGLVAWSAALEVGTDDSVDPSRVGRLFIDAYRRAARRQARTDPAPLAAPTDPLPLPASFAAVPSPAPPDDPLPLPASFAAVPPLAPAAVPTPGESPPAMVPDAPPPAEGAPGDGPRRPRRRGASRTRLRDEHRSFLITLCTWLRNIGVLMILFAGWQLWGTAIAQHHAQSTLKSQFDAKVKAAPPKAGFTLTPASVELSQPPEGTVMALIQVPKIGIDQYVVSGTAEDDLAKGPGHYVGTAMPGQAGNVAIAGHRTTHGAPFNRLAELAPGDPIYLTTVTGQRLTYIVAQTPYPVSPSNTSVLNYFGDNRLTLTTCNPEFSASQRLIVVAAYQPPGAAPRALPAHANGTPVKVKATGEAGWNMTLMPLVLLELALLVALGLSNGRLGRLLGREGRWLVLVPIWLALLFALFQSLTSFLPAAA